MVRAGESVIKNTNELEFAIFCIENVAAKLNTSGEAVYKAWTLKSDLLSRYIVPVYDVLHTQSKEYIVDDIIRVMEEEGVEV